MNNDSHDDELGPRYSIFCAEGQHAKCDDCECDCHREQERSDPRDLYRVQ